MRHRRPAFDPIYQRVAWHELRQGPEFRAWRTCSLVLERMIGIYACDDVERASFDDHDALDAAEDACLAAIVAPRLPYEATVLAGPWIAGADRPGAAERPSVSRTARVPPRKSRAVGSASV